MTDWRTRHNLRAAATATRRAVSLEEFYAQDDIESELRRQRAVHEARRRLAAEERGPIVVPEPMTLRDQLAVDRPPVTYRIDGWQPAQSRVMLAAQFKAGKTTLVANVIRALADSIPFLGRHEVRPVTGTVGIIDTEMSERQGLAWLRAQGIRSDDRVIPWFLRGRVHAFDPTDRENRSLWAARLRETTVEYLILDCLRPVLDALGLDEHRDAGRVLVGLDALLAEAGIPDALVVHHMGHLNERSRGDSRLRDWPDVEWRLVRQDDDPASARYLSAYGRDVDQPEAALRYETAGRRITIGAGSRQDAAARAALDDVLSVLDDESKSGRAVVAACTEAGTSHSQAALRAALAYGIRTGVILAEPGPRRSVLHRRSSVSVSRSVSSVSQHGESECFSAPIGAHNTLTGHFPAVSVLPDEKPFHFDPRQAFIRDEGREEGEP